VDRLSYADTLGILTPQAVERIRSAIESSMPFNMLHFHFHNDFGRAFDNAVAAAENGARCIDASLLGIGERMGLVPLESVLAFLQGKSNKEYKPAPLWEAIELVRSRINQDHYKNRRFAHKSGIHINGTIKDPATYEPFKPDIAGAKRIYVLSKLIGRSGLRMISSRCGLELDDEELDEILEQVKSDEFLETADDREITLYLTINVLKRRTMYLRV